MNEKELKGAESQEEKPKRKAAPKKKGPSAAERAKLRAEEIRKEMANRKTLVPGDILNGDPDLYAYYHVASGLPSTDRLIATMAQLGYEKCVDGEQMIGMNGGQLYRCPKEITEQRAKEKAARLKK
mgnify:FL=1